VRVQLPITLAPGSEPEPDFAIVRIDENRYSNRHPQPQDVLLLIEVADSTWKHNGSKPALGGHRTHKAQIYAKAGIGEYWIVNLKKREVVVLQDPQDGLYQSEQTFTENDQIAPLLLPDVVVKLRYLIL